MVSSCATQQSNLVYVNYRWAKTHLSGKSPTHSNHFAQSIQFLVFSYDIDKNQLYISQNVLKLTYMYSNFERFPRVYTSDPLQEQGKEPEGRGKRREMQKGWEGIGGREEGEGEWGSPADWFRLKSCITTPLTLTVNI